MTDCKPTMSVVADDAFKFESDGHILVSFSSGHARWSRRSRIRTTTTTTTDSTMESLSRPMRPFLLHHVVSRASSFFHKGSRRCSKQEASEIRFRRSIFVLHCRASFMSRFRRALLALRIIVTATSTNRSLFQRSHMTIIPVLSSLRAPPTRPGRLPYNHRQCN
jgi:hypothetical protein